MRRWGADTDAAITRIRRDLEAQGKEPGAWSVWWVLSQGGSRQAPSRSTIARRMRALGLVVPAPRKRPRSSWKRFTRTSANELRQLDGIEWRLAGRPVTVYQAIDDCSRVITALKAFWGGESHQGAKEALEAAFRDWGRPAALLSGNGPALNTSRWSGSPCRTERWLASLGVRPISGRVGHPQTQGKVERAHQSLQTWLRAHPAGTLEEPSTELAAFQTYYNTERQHQGHSIAHTPLMIWNQVDRALPYPAPVNLDALDRTAPLTLPAPGGQPEQTRRNVHRNGTVSYKNRVLNVGRAMSGQTVTLLEHPLRLDLVDAHDELLGSMDWPQPKSTKDNRTSINVTDPPYRLARQHPTTPAPQAMTPERLRSHDTQASQKP